MISKNDFVMLNWGNLVQKDPSVLYSHSSKELEKIIDNIVSVYEKIGKAAPENTILQAKQTLVT